MALGSSDRVQIRRKTTVESTWGETPATPAMTNVACTSANFNAGKTTASSPEIRSDGQLSDITQLGFQAAGDFGIALKYTEYDWAIESLLRSTWGSTITVVGSGAAGDIQFEADPYNAIRAPSMSQYSVGQWVKVSGATQAANNGYFKILQVNPSSIEVDGPLTAEDSSTATVTGCMIRMGTSELNYLLEREFNDITQFDYITGARISQMALNIASRSIITGTVNFLGKRLFTSATTIGAASPTAAQSTPIMNASTSVGAIYEGGSVLSTALKSLAVTINGNLRPQDQIASLSLAQVAFGTFAVTGTVQAYFQDQVMRAKALNHTTTSLATRMTDDDGNTLIMTLPTVKLSGDPRAGGQNQDVDLSLTMEAFRDPVTATMIQFDRFPA